MPREDGRGRICTHSLLVANLHQVTQKLPEVARWIEHLEYTGGIPPRLRHLLLAHSEELGKDGLSVNTADASFFERYGHPRAKGLHLASRRDVTVNGRRHFMFFDGDISTQRAEIYVKNSIIPVEKMLTVIHELAHCRFEQFWRRNHRQLARHLPATIAFHEDEYATMVDAKHFSDLSERFAVAMETKVAQEIVHCAQIVYGS